MSYIVYQQKKDIAYAMLDKLIALSYSKQEIVNIALSGGSTPKTIFKFIGEQDKAIIINWQKLHFWWCDERCVEFKDKESNFGEADRLLFQKLNIPRENLHPMQGYIASEEAVLHYVKQLKNQVLLVHGIPQFDWVWLGMGGDGHIASLFVNDAASLYSEKWVKVAYHPVTKQLRITLTLEVINNAKSIDFLVVGASKANMLAKVFDLKIESLDYPAKAVSLNQGRLLWHLDQNAASEIA